MGWCSATGIFDSVMREVTDLPETQRKRVARVLYDTLTREDWDCESDSDFYVEYILDIELADGRIDQAEYDEYKKLYS